MSVSASETVLTVQKRDGALVPFVPKKIEIAAYKAFEAYMPQFPEVAKDLAASVTDRAVKLLLHRGKELYNVEDIQDLVEEQIFIEGHPDVARSYILYREERRRQRLNAPPTPEEEALYARNSRYFKSQYAEAIYFRTYARWRDDLGRREVWEETVQRVVDFFREIGRDRIPEEDYLAIHNAILWQQVMPSMRLMWSAGEAARRQNFCIINCTGTAVDCLEAFSETLYILMCGSGCGYSVERKFVEKLARIHRQRKTKIVPIHFVEDSKEGWADALYLGLKVWFDGRDIQFDYSEIRPPGARLYTMGGRASGYLALKRLLDFARDLVLNHQGEKLEPIDCHDLMCQIAEIVVVGGVRRSSLISLSDLEDLQMRDAKRGYWHKTHLYRRMANNSAVFNRRPTVVEFLKEWTALVDSGSGERGIFNRSGFIKKMTFRRKKVLKRKVYDLITNPCSEIVAPSGFVCNLSECIARPDDTRITLREKVRIATIIGTLQSAMIHFPYVRKMWRDNAEKERLLGVSVTGQLDCPAWYQDEEFREQMRDYAIDVNSEYADKLGINHSTAITATKPSGTCSQLCQTASGIHPWYASYYIRRVRINALDPIARFFQDECIPSNPENGDDPNNPTTLVFEFPEKSPEGAPTRHTFDAIQQLELWLSVKKSWAEHSISMTTYVADDEWLKVGQWVYEHFDEIGGVSFLPRDGGNYTLAPYQEISKKEYDQLTEAMTTLHWYKLKRYEENTDNTIGAKSLACSGGACEL